MIEYWGFETEHVNFIKTDRIPFFPKNRPAKLPADKRTSKPIIPGFQSSIILPLSSGMSEVNQVHFSISFNEKEPFAEWAGELFVLFLLK